MLTPERLDRMNQVARSRQAGLVVVLEDIHDPHNAAAVVRTCDAFGIQNVHLIFRREPYYDPRRRGKNSSSSANRWIDFELFRSTGECLERLRRQGYRLAATEPGPEAQPLFQADLTAPRLAILVGNERFGLSAEALALADLRLAVPMTGMVQSLNLSVSTAIVLYEVLRQRTHRQQEFQAGEDEARALVARWTKRNG